MKKSSLIAIVGLLVACSSDGEPVADHAPSLDLKATGGAGGGAPSLSADSGGSRASTSLSEE